MFKRLHRRLTLLCTLATGVIVVAMACACLAISQGQLARSAQAPFRSDARGILSYIRSQAVRSPVVLDHGWLSQTEASGSLILHIEASGAPILYQTATPALGGEPAEEAITLAARTYGLDLRAVPDALVPPEDVSFQFRAQSGEDYRAVLSCIPLRTGWVGVVVLQSMAAEQAELAGLRLLFGLFALAALVLLALFAWRFTRRALRPIEESQRKQAEFVAAASHELRSPLAVIHASLSALPGSTPAQIDHFAALADGECMRMSRLVGDLLTLTSADGGAWSIRLGQVELETLVLTVCERFEAQAAGRGLYLSASLPEQPLPRCLCDGERIDQLLSILVDNALSYTPAGGRVTVAVSTARDGFLLAVSDTGPGVPDGEKERIFERFYRSDPARASREHYGLGLCVAREIAALHRGSLIVEDHPSGGAVFVLFLPLA